MVFIRAFVVSYLYPQLTPITILFFMGMTLLMLTIYWESVAFANYFLQKKYSYEKNLSKRITLQITLSYFLTLPFLYFLIINFEDILPINVDKFMYIIFFFVNLIIIVTINMGYFGNYFLQKWKKSLVENERVEKERAIIQKRWSQLQYNNLQNQLNPHFFFNSIASLQSLIREDAALASEFLKQLSKVYRYILQNNESSLVTLENEIEFAHQFFSLLKTRFGNALQFQINISHSALEMHIVPVTMQVLVENAIKHNIMSDDNPLVITIEDKNERLLVKNNFQPKKSIEYSNKIGLTNMKDLYKHLSDEKLIAGLKENFFEVEIPLIKWNDRKHIEYQDDILVKG
jgi:two-component system, LytTR family, sensor kinase